MKTYFFLCLFCSFFNGFAQSADEWFEKAEQAADSSNYREAINCYVRAIKLGFKSDGYYENKIEKEKLKYANIANFDTSKIRMNTIIYLNNRAIVRSGNYNQNAITDFNKAIRLNTNDNDSLTAHLYYSRALYGNIWQANKKDLVQALDSFALSNPKKAKEVAILYNNIGNMDMNILPLN